MTRLPRELVDGLLALFDAVEELGTLEGASIAAADRGRPLTPTEIDARRCQLDRMLTAVRQCRGIVTQRTGSRMH